MVFVEWYRIAVYCMVCALLAAAVFVFWSVRRKKAIVRVPLRLLSVALAFGPIFMVLIWWAFPNPNRYSAPVYSPDGKAAARVWDYDPGPLGRADSSVEVFTAHGLESHVIFTGE